VEHLDDPIDAVEEMLEEAGRACLRLIAGPRPLKREQYQALSKWMFGCMNQRYTIRGRVEKRGIRELRNVLRFVAQACEVILEIESDESGSE